MIKIIGKIAVILGIDRDGKAFGKTKKKRKSLMLRRESDTITISAEARRLLSCGGAEGEAMDEARVK